MFRATRIHIFALVAPLFVAVSEAADCAFEDAADAHNWQPGWVDKSVAKIMAPFKRNNPVMSDGYVIEGVSRDQPQRFWDLYDAIWDGTREDCEAWCDQMEGPNGELCAFAAWEEPDDKSRAFCYLYSCVPNCYELKAGKSVASANCPDWNTDFDSSVKSAKTWANLCVLHPTCTTSTTITTDTTTTTTSITTTTTTTATTTTTTATTTTTSRTTTTTSITSTTTSVTSTTTSATNTITSTTTTGTTTTTTPVITDYRLTVTRGPCEETTQNMCVRSVNYPGAYPTGSSNACQIFGPAGAKLKVWGFSTEFNKDVLFVNGNKYSGSLSPVGETLTKEAISWIPQGTAAGGAATGWWICLENAAESTTTVTVTTTTTTITATTTTTATNTTTVTTSTTASTTFTHTSQIETNTEAIIIYDVDLELAALSAGEITNLEGQLLQVVSDLPFVGMQFIYSIELEAGNRGTGESAVIDQTNPFAVMGVVAKIVLKPQAAEGLAKAAADAIDKTKKGTDLVIGVGDGEGTFTINGVFDGFAVIFHPQTTTQTTTTTVDTSLRASTDFATDAADDQLDSASVAIIVVTVMIAFVLVVIMIYMWVTIPKHEHEFQTLKFLARDAVGEANGSKYQIPSSSPTIPPSTTSKLIMETVNATGAALYGAPTKFSAGFLPGDSPNGASGVSPSRHYKASSMTGSTAPSISNVDANDHVSTLLRGGGGVPRSVSQAAFQVRATPPFAAPPAAMPTVTAAIGSRRDITAEDVGAFVTVYGYTGEGRLAFYGKHVEFGTARCGVVFDSAIGRNNGTVGGHAYFECAANCGVLVAPGKVDLADE